MKKILYVTTVSRTINAFLVPHIEMLLNKGYEVDCASSIDKPIDGNLLSNGVIHYEVSFCRNPLSLGNIRAFLKLKELQRKNQYDIIHVHTPVASIYGRLLKLWFPRVKTVYTAHGYHFYKGAPRKNWIIFYPIEKIMAKLTDVTININKEDYDITKERLKPKKCYRLKGVGVDLSKYSNEEIAVDIEEFNRCIKAKNIDLNIIKKEALRENIQLKSKDFIVLMIAEVNGNKNHVQLIKAMSLLKERYPEIKAICVGDGDKLKEMNSYVKENNLEENVRFLGFREDIRELIEIADIGILLSYREGLPRSIMELMAKGKRIIATDVRGCRDLVENEQVGILVKVGDYEGTAKAIEEYYNTRMDEVKIPKAIKKYDVNHVVREIEEIYRELIDENKDLPLDRRINVKGSLGA